MKLWALAALLGLASGLKTLDEDAEDLDGLREEPGEDEELQLPPPPASAPEKAAWAGLRAENEELHKLLATLAGKIASDLPAPAVAKARDAVLVGIVAALCVMWYAMIRRFSASANQWKGGTRACAEGRERLPEEDLLDEGEEEPLLDQLHSIKAEDKEPLPGEDLPGQPGEEEEQPLEEPESEVPPQRQGPTKTVAADNTADEDHDAACWYYTAGPSTSNPNSTTALEFRTAAGGTAEETCFLGTAAASAGHKPTAEELAEADSSSEDEFS